MHERVSANAICFPGESFEAIAGHWRELGARRVSLATALLTEEALPATQAALAAGGHAVETITHLFSPGRPLSDAEARRAATGSLSALIAAAGKVRANSIYILSGGRGPLVWEDAAEAFAEALAPCLPQARDAGVALLIEPVWPVNAEHHISHSLRDTVRLAEIADIGVSIDIFPCWAEAGLQETITRAAPRLGLVQAGDYVLGDKAQPCRAVVGEGDIPVARILGWVLDAGYAGCVDLELMGPRIDQAGRVEAVRRSAERVGEILDAHVRR
jgi:sugar phosphate isomerase/epimerase